MNAIIPLDLFAKKIKVGETISIKWKSTEGTIWEVLDVKEI